MSTNTSAYFHVKFQQYRLKRACHVHVHGCAGGSGTHAARIKRFRAETLCLCICICADADAVTSHALCRKHCPIPPPPHATYDIDAVIHAALLEDDAGLGDATSLATCAV